MKLPPKSIITAHHFHQNVTFRWLYGGPSFYLTLSSTSVEAIDAWYAVIKLVAEGWDPSQKFPAIYDLSGVALTPHFRKRSVDVADAVRHLRGWYAIIVGDDQSADMMSQHFQLDVQRMTARVGRVFTEFDDAWAWISETL